MVSHYQVLGVEANASQGEIKQAYRDRMKAHHSDRHGQDGDPVVQLINEAYRVLSDPVERRQYDEELSGKDEASYEKEVFSPRPTVLQPPPPFGGLSWSFGKPLLAPPPRPQSRTRTHQAQNRTREMCGRCHGRGFHPGLGVAWPCQYCDGQGWVPGKVAL